MDPVTIDLVGLTRSLVDIDSTTGRERDVGVWLSRFLRDLGCSVTEQPVDGSRFNILATAPQAPAHSTSPASFRASTASAGAPPVLVLSTHFDCVPPFFPSRLEGDRIVGRGSCDAKGILAAQVAAAAALWREGESRVGLLFVVGEERGSDGARVANRAAKEGVNACRFLVNGEPTDNRLGLATRGMMRVKLRARGRAAHSSFPELGDSAIDKLLDALMELRTIELPSDPVLGRTHYTVGLISGGAAPNVVSPSAEAEVMFRTVADAEEVRRAIARLEPRVAIEAVHDVPPAKLMTVPGFDTAVFPYTTDIPTLSAWGQPLLFGPGSIHVAHTAEEFVDVAELRTAVDAYVKITRELLSQECQGL